jgi:PleD family two-component response regulator
MKNKIRILLVEDVAADAELIREALLKGGLSFTLHRVETEADFLHELQRHPPDVILSDHGFPSFDGFKALELAQEHCAEIPFIFVTGSLGEEVAIASFNNGVADYVLKDRLLQLPPAIERALREMEDRAARKQLEAERDQLIQELKESLTQIKALTGLLPICAFCKKVRDHQSGWQHIETYLQNHSDAMLTHELCPECEMKISPAMLKSGQLYSGLTSNA